MTCVGNLLTMRAQIERNTSAVDGYGTKAAAGMWDIVSPSEHCLVITRSKREVLDGTKVVYVETMLGLFRESADILEGDRLNGVSDRRGQSLFDCKLAVGPVVLRVVLGSKRKEAILTRADG